MESLTEVVELALRYYEAIAPDHFYAHTYASLPMPESISDSFESYDKQSALQVGKFGISHTIGISCSCSLSVAAGCAWLTAAGIVGVSSAIAANNYQLWCFKLNGVESDTRTPRVSLGTSWVYLPILLEGSQHSSEMQA